MIALTREVQDPRRASRHRPLPIRSQPEPQSLHGQLGDPSRTPPAPRRRAPFRAPNQPRTNLPFESGRLVEPAFFSIANQPLSRARSRPPAPSQDPPLRPASDPATGRRRKSNGYPTSVAFESGARVERVIFCSASIRPRESFAASAHGGARLLGSRGGCGHGGECESPGRPS
jgi:hypothetical protein